MRRCWARSESPRMEQRRYKPHMAIGPILGVGGACDHHSAPRPSRSCWPESPISMSAAWLIAGLLPPGLLLALLFALVIAVQLWRDRTPPPIQPAADTACAEAAAGLRRYDADRDHHRDGHRADRLRGRHTHGIRRFGVLGVLIAAALFGRLGLGAIVQALKGTVIVGGMLFFIRHGIGRLQPVARLFRRQSGLPAMGLFAQPRSAGGARSDPADPAGPGHLHGPGLGHAHHGADLLSAGHGARVRPDMVRGPDPVSRSKSGS